MLAAPVPDPAIRLRVLSLGAGVQSTTLALMAAHGEIGPMPDCPAEGSRARRPDPAPLAEGADRRTMDRHLA